MLGIGLGLMNWRGTGGALSAYAVNTTQKPKVVADFAGELSPSGSEFYAKGGLMTDFDSLFAYTGASNKTMTDSDGYLKWAPHNIVPLSADLTDTGEWNGTGATIAASSEVLSGFDVYEITATASTGTYRRIASTTSHTFTTDARYKIQFRAKAGGTDFVHITLTNSQGRAWFNLSSATASDAGTKAGSEGASISSLGDGWYLCTLDLLGKGNSALWWIGPLDADQDPATSDVYDGTESVHIAGLQTYRCDLGGMVNNFERSDNYVETTTSSPVYLPRRNSYRYNGSAYVNKGLTLESVAATNLVAVSNDFDGTGWSVSASAVVTDNAGTGPDGVSTSADKIVDSSAGGTAANVQVSYNVSGFSTATAHTFSVFLKEDGLSWAAIRPANFTTPAAGSTFFDLATGVVGTTASGHTAVIENVGGGWYRCAVTFTTDAADTNGDIVVRVATADGNETVDLDGTSSILAYGAQWEVGSVPSSYIPTSGATATRSAETLTIAGADMAASTSAMSFHVQGEFQADGNLQRIIHWGASASDMIEMYKEADSDVVARQIVASTSDAITLTGAFAASTGLNLPFNLASRNTSGAINAASNGTAATEDSTPTSLTDLSSTTFYFLRNFSGGSGLGTVALFRQWDEDIADTGIAEASGTYDAEKIIANFAADTYNLNGSSSDFDTMFNYTATSNSTMVDSDGYLKWAPHNLVVRSDFDAAAPSDWSEFGTDGTKTLTSLSTGESAIRFNMPTAARNYIAQNITFVAGASYTVSIWAENISAGTASTVTLCQVLNADYTPSSVQIKVSDIDANGFGTASFTADGPDVTGQIRIGVGVTGNESGDATIGGVHIYRSDLGGMVNNPDRSDSYVPTTTAAVYQSRRNAYRYTGAAYENKGLLLESAAATNLLGYSVVDDGTQWTESNATNTVNNTTSPTGQTDATTITASAGNAVHYCGDQFTVPASVGTYAMSACLKAGTTNYALVFVSGGAPGLDAEYVVNLSTGAITQTLSAGTHTPTFDEMGSGWWRVTITDTTNGTGGSPTFFVGPHDGSAARIWTAAGTETIHVWHCQAEESDVATSIVPTTGATATRAAQTLTIPAANMSWNNEGQSFQIEGEITYADTGNIVQRPIFWQDDTSNEVYLYLNTETSRTGQLGAVYEVGGSPVNPVGVSTTQYSPGVNVPFSKAILYNPFGSNSSHTTRSNALPLVIYFVANLTKSIYLTICKSLLQLACIQLII